MQRMLINGASFPAQSPAPYRGRRDNVCKSSQALWVAAGGVRTSLERNDSCIEMRRLPRGYFGGARWKRGETDSCDLQCHDRTFALPR